MNKSKHLKFKIMGKSLVIKNANFSSVAVEQVSFVDDVNISSLFSFTDNDRWIADPENSGFGMKLTSSTNKYRASNKVDISDFASLTLTSTLVASTENATGFLFFDAGDNALTAGAHYTKGQAEDAYETLTVNVPEGAKYIATTIFMESYLPGDFTCIGHY